MSQDAVLYEVSDHVATITFNRPEQQNTISSSMLNALTSMLLEADADTDVRAIILTGTGKFFCAGLDLRSGGNPVDSAGREPLGRGSRASSRTSTS